jgi:hypothetical protein
LKIEADILAGHIRRGWEPINNTKTGKKEPSTIPSPTGDNLSTLKDKKSEVDKLPSRPPKEKLGRKPVDLPDDLIRELASRGMGSKAITTELKNQGYSISYKTIQRRLKTAILYEWRV